METLSLIGHKDCLNSVETEGLMNCTSGNFYKKDYNRKQCANWELNAHCLSPITLYGSSFKTEASFSCLCLSSTLSDTVYMRYILQSMYVLSVYNSHFFILMVALNNHLHILIMGLTVFQSILKYCFGASKLS